MAPWNGCGEVQRIKNGSRSKNKKSFLLPISAAINNYHLSLLCNLTA